MLRNLAYHPDTVMMVVSNITQDIHSLYDALCQLQLATFLAENGYDLIPFVRQTADSSITAFDNTNRTWPYGTDWASGFRSMSNNIEIRIAFEHARLEELARNR
jgi:hypothetical protein